MRAAADAAALARWKATTSSSSCSADVLSNTEKAKALAKELGIDSGEAKAEEAK